MLNKKSILWFVKDENGINANKEFYNTNSLFSVRDLTREKIDVYNKNFNAELDTFSYAFENSMWECYWTCMDFVNFENKEIIIYNRKRDKYQSIQLSQLDSEIGFIIFKYLGSVEGQRDKILATITLLEQEYSGIIINHPITMKYFIDKKYLKDMEIRGFPNLIKNTSIFENNVKYTELVENAEKLGRTSEFIIKPLTGELANSFSLLNDADEAFLRRKQNKVGGWILQPLTPHIWNGEHRLIFIGNMCSIGLKKIYIKKDSNQILPNEKERVFCNYIPTKDELGWATNIRKMWEDSMNHKIYYFRLDFVKDENNKPYMLEFEALNPGFGFSVIPEKSRMRIANEFISFLNFYSF